MCTMQASPCLAQSRQMRTETSSWKAPEQTSRRTPSAPSLVLRQARSFLSRMYLQQDFVLKEPMGSACVVWQSVECHLRAVQLRKTKAWLRRLHESPCVADAAAEGSSCG